MDDLVQFLRARLNDDERAARAAGGAWREFPGTNWINTAPSCEWQPPGSDHHVAVVPLEGDRAHIARHDPARVLRDVKAWRTLLKEHDLFLDGAPDDFSGAWAMEAVMRSKAAVYADHPDYRDDWRP